MGTNKQSDSAPSILTFFSRANFRFNIHNLSYLPRWIIVVIDFTILFLAFFFAKLIINGIGLRYMVDLDRTTYVFFILSFNLFTFWVFRSYAGIIRHSSYIDAVKLFLSQFTVFIVFLLFNFEKV